MEALRILNAWRARHAKQTAKDAVKTLEDVKEKLSKIEKAQEKIVENAKDLVSRDASDEELKKELDDMLDAQKKMKDMVEEMSHDLSQFPELPVCDELNSKMRGIFEAVEQAIDSKEAPAQEIAVQKEDGILEAIKNTKERVEDTEMWLPDSPDNISWKMESFDTSELPDMPLTPLPDELQDLVGELLEQSESAASKSEDATGNNMVAGGEMGWAVQDGPMPSFAAKGKSGNTRPNDNEMTGRSGSGREGQSSGELVEDHVKGLEGTKTHARRTKDPLQKGQVTESKHSKLDARSTGGGKLGGVSETIGMFGKSPRRDLHMPEHGRKPRALRREAEALYTKARLLYLDSGSLGQAVRELRAVEDVPELRSMGLHQRVMKRLRNSQVEIASGTSLPLPTLPLQETGGGTAVKKSTLEDLPGEYRRAVSDYYRSLGQSD